MKKWQALTGIVLVMAGIGMWLGCIRPLQLPLVHAGVSVEGVAVGGLTREEIMQMISLWQKEYQQREISVYYGDTVFRLSASHIDYDVDVDATVKEIWNFGRQGSWYERLKNIYSARKEGHRVRLRMKYNEAKMAAVFDQWKEAIDRPPRNAALSILSEEGIVPHEQGRKLEIQALKPIVLQAFHDPNRANLPLPVTPVYPEVTVADISQTGIKEVLAKYSTAFDGEQVNRTANIRLAAQKIHGVIVYPGQTFSFNETVGPRDKERGFKEALEIVNGEFVPGIGGGVCQVSSTLYNAVLLADLMIRERYNHSKPLVYVPLGRDATVVYNGLDFKFMNNKATPVMIMAEVRGNTLYTAIFGQQRSMDAVEIVSAERQVIPPLIIKKPDQGMYIGETKLDKQGKPGYEVTTIRVVRTKKGEIRREVLSKDRYLPEDTVVKVGTKPPKLLREEDKK